MKVFIKSFFIFFLLTFYQNIFSQTAIDSLESKLDVVNGNERIEILNELIKAYDAVSNTKSLDYALQAFELTKKIKGKEDVAASSDKIGRIYFYLDDYDKSIEYFINSLKIREEIGNKLGISQSYNNLGVIYLNIENYNKAQEFFLNSLKISEDISDKDLMAKNFINLGIASMQLNNHDEALEYYLSALTIYKKTDNKKLIAICLNNLGINYWYLNNFSMSLEYYLEALKLKEEIGDIWGISNTSLNIGQIYVKLKNYKKAFIYINNALEIADKIESKHLQKNSYNNFSELYTAREDYQKALEYYKLYTEVKDSIFTEESSEKIAEMQTKYETEKKEKENEILKKDNDIQKLEINKQQNLRNSFIVISVLVLILASVIYARYRSKQKINIILNQKNTLIENANTELNQKNKQITKQKNQLSGTLKELRETQKMLTDTAHRAGMAEIATGILHNVGNVLNSVKVSSQILKEKILSSKVNSLQQVLSIMEEHKDDIGKFITSDEKGKMLPEYLIKVGTTLKDEQNNSLEELSNLHEGINHIEEIIAVQQSYAGVSGLIEKVKLSKMMDDVLKMHSEMFRKYKIKIEKNYSKTKPILIEKGKLIQVFVNLLKNAKESLEAKEKDRIIIINILEDKGYQVIEIVDNGIGIAKINLESIFSYGFSTKKGGKGFGLHTSALAMSEMKGKLTAKSEGEEKGAEFMVKVPTENYRRDNE
ncbi:MAG: tetratricopeptide repeat-containing sensor histidine kinase [Candidatus Cloacimonadota bacterium]|nr:tetratricopeptide repeat-containing sensor histidine kinase [Candidatus Cloacimonadota bacterium]